MISIRTIFTLSSFLVTSVTAQILRHVTFVNVHVSTPKSLVSLTNCNNLQWRCFGVCQGVGFIRDHLRCDAVEGQSHPRIEVSAKLAALPPGIRVFAIIIHTVLQFVSPFTARRASQKTSACVTALLFKEVAMARFDISTRCFIVPVLTTFELKLTIVITCFATDL